MGWPSNYLTIQTVDCSEQLTLAGVTFFCTPSFFK